MYCVSCGKKLEDGDSFCPGCGAPAVAVKEGGAPVSPASGIKPGFSDKINDPAIRAAMKKNNKAAGVFAVLLVLAPPVVTLILSLKNNDFSYFRHGMILAAVFLVFYLISVTKKKGEKQWDGTVTEKHTETRQEKTSADGDDCLSTYTLYIE